MRQPQMNGCASAIVAAVPILKEREVNAMQELQQRPEPTLDVRSDQPLIGVIFHQDGQEVVRYFADETAAGMAARQNTVERALAAVGSWADLDFDETLDELARIRHESTLTPPIELDV